jgi:quercetin dioxygenase-like cupin family protein
MAEALKAPEIWRIYTKDNGMSAMERIDLAMNPGAGAGTASKMLAGEGVQFRWFPPDMNADWHPAPRRQMVATLSGEGEIETGDGQKLVVKPGVMTLLEDTHGKGHQTRAHGGSGRLSVFLPLDDGTTVP